MASGLNLLPILLAIIEEQHMGKAAARLGISQPAISRSLQALREQYNDQIVIRKASGVTPTAFAMELYPTVKQAVEILSNTYNRKKLFDPRLIEKNFSVSCPADISFFLLLPLMTKIRSISSKLQLNVQSMHSDDIHAELRSMQLDGVIGILKDEYTSLNKTYLFTDKLILVCNRDHPRINTPTITMEEYLAEQHVVVSQGYRRSYLSSTDIKEIAGRQVAMSTTGPLDILPIVAETDLIGFSTVRNYESFGKHFNVKKVELPFEKTEFDIFMFWHPQRESDLAHRWLRELVVEYSGKHLGEDTVQPTSETLRRILED